MYEILLFLSGMLFANGIPHFVNGISGRPFVEPFLYRFVPWMPNPLFNVVWGMISMAIAYSIICLYRLARPESTLFGQSSIQLVIFVAGFVVSSIGLSLFFARTSL